MKWETLVVLFAVIFWGGVAAVVMLPRARALAAALSLRARRTSLRTTLAALALVVAFGYAYGTKPTVKPAFSYTDNGDGTATLLTVTNTPTSSALALPADYDDLAVVALADGFCNGTTAAKFTSVSIPATVVSIGDGFFGYGQGVTCSLNSISVAESNAYCAVTQDGVLYERATGRVICALHDEKRVRFPVLYKDPEQSAPTQVVYKVYGETLTLASSNLFSKAGYLQSGWGTNRARKEVVYGLGAAYTNNAAVTLYPVWTPDPSVSCTVIFDAMGGAGDFPGSMLIPFDEVVDLPACTLTKAGFIFAGWSENNANGLPVYADGDEIGYSRAEGLTNTLHAVWLKPNGYGLAFDPAVEGAVWSMPRQTFGTDEVAGLSPCTLVPPTGKKFAGWLGAFNGRRYDDGILVHGLTRETNTVIVLRAVWQD